MQPPEGCTRSTHCPFRHLESVLGKLIGAHLPYENFKAETWVCLHSWVFFLFLDLRFSFVSLIFQSLLLSKSISISAHNFSVPFGY